MDKKIFIKLNNDHNTHSNFNIKKKIQEQIIKKFNKFNKSTNIHIFKKNTTKMIIPTKIIPKMIIPTKITPKMIIPTKITPKMIIPTKIKPKMIIPTKITHKMIIPTKIKPKMIIPTKIKPKMIIPTKITPTKITPKMIIPKKIIPTIIHNQSLKIGVCVRVKNEQNIIKDWVNYYLKLGFDFIYIYDNLSNPSVAKTLGNYDRNKIKIKNDLVEKSNQFAVYQDCLNNNKHLDWLLICDADEFLYIKEGTIINFLNNFSNDTGTILINSLVFGTSGLLTYDSSKSIFEQFIKREPYNFRYNGCVKSFIRVKYIKFINSWHKIFNSNYLIKDVDNNIVEPIRANANWKYKISNETNVIIVHYMTLDFNSMQIKRVKNSLFDMAVAKTDKYTIEWYNLLFKDEILDKRMIKDLS